MRRPIRAVILLAALAGLAWFPSAAAGRFHPDQLELERAIQAGDEFWRHDPQNHCLAHNGGTIDTTFPERHATAAGYSVNGVCGTIHILRSRAEQYTRSQFCVLVVHEYGHTIDHVHVADPASIMYARPVSAGFRTKACEYPDPHGSSGRKAHKRRRKPQQASPRPPPRRPLPLPSSFEIVLWVGSASDRR